MTNTSLGLKVLMAGLLPLVALTTTPAQADSGLQLRAKCAGVDLAITMDERVSKSDRAACASRPPIPRVKTKAKEPFADARPMNKLAVSKGKPAWINSIPTNPGIFYGVGEGLDTMVAYQKALVQVAAQVKTEIHSEMNSSIRETGTDTINADGSESSTSTSTEDSSEVSRAIVKGSMKDVKMIGRYVDAKGTHHVLAALDQAAVERRDQEMIDAVFETLSEITERFVQRQKDEGVLSQSNLRELTLALSEVNGLGKTKMGKKQKKKWKPAYRSLQKLVKKMVNCVVATGNYVLASGKEVSLKSSPTLTRGSKIRLALTCGGVPIADAEMKTYPSGGLVQIPTTFSTDSEGKAEISVGSVLGAGVKMGFTHALEDVPGAFWLSSVKPTRKSEITFRAGAPATIRFDVKGGNKAENRLVAEELGSFAQRQWGATTVKSGAILVGKARLRFPPPRAVRGKYAAPIELDVALTLAGSGGSLIDTTVRTGGVGASAKAAREKAMSTLGQQVARLRVKPVMSTSVQVVLPCRMAGVDPSKPKTIEQAVGKCVKFLSNYKKDDRESIIAGAAPKIQNQLAALASPAGVPSEDVGDIKALKKGIKLLKKTRKSCQRILSKTKGSELLSIVSDACNTNVESQRNLQAAIDGIKRAEAEAKAEAKRLKQEIAEAEKMAKDEAKQSARKRLNCEIRCKKAANARGQANDDWEIMEVTYRECIESGKATGCIREAIQFCVRACVQ